MSDEQTKQHPAQKIARSILINQLALNANEDLLFSAPGTFNRKLKYAFKNYIEELRKSEIDFDMLFNQQENASVGSYEAIEKFMQVVSRVQIWDMENVSDILKAYEEDPRSMEGIAKKILKHKNI